MSKQYAADKENQRDRTVGMRSAMGDGSFKGLSLASRKDLGLNVDKSARLVGKKDAIKLTPSLLQNPLVSANIQNYTKKLLANASRNDEITKDTSIPQRKNYGPPGPKSSLLSNYLSRDKDLRLNSRSKPKREEESERRVQHELLQPSKSNMQIGNLNTKIQNILQPIKKAVKKARETNDMSSMSNVSEISDVSRNNRHHYARESDLQAYKSTEKSSIANFGKDKKAFFSKKPAPKPSKPVPKKAFASVNKSRMSGSSYSIETTPDKVDKNTVLMMDKIKPMLSNALSNTLAMRVKDNAATVNNTSKVVRMKNEKLVCLENLVVKNELGISIKTQERFIGDSGFLTKGIVKRRELTIEEEIKNFVQENQGGVYTSETLGYMIQSEAEYMPDPYYLDKNQNEIKWKMRAMLLDWLIEVCADFTLKISTFHYAVNYIDRYLSIVSNIQKSNFQLVGLTALSLATKIEEVFVPHLSDFAVSASNIFSVDTIKKMELNMLKVS